MDKLLILFLVLVALVTPASSQSGYIQSEAGDCLNAENADRLITEDVSSGTSCVSLAPTIPPLRTLQGAGT